MDNLPENVKLCKKYIFKAKKMQKIGLLKEAIEYIESNTKTVVICPRGRSRSPTTIIGYLMFKKHLSFEQAIEELKKTKGDIKPNAELVESLKEFEKFLKDNNYTI